MSVTYTAVLLVRDETVDFLAGLLPRNAVGGVPEALRSLRPATAGPPAC
jgi:hypothetical protein